MAHVAILVALCAAPAWATTYFLNPACSGCDANPGTSAAAPWQTLLKVRTATLPGDTVNVLAGTYTPSQYKGEAGMPTWTETQHLGTAGNPITIQANPGDTVIFDGQNELYWMHFTASGPYNGHYVIVQNLTFQHYAGVAIGIDGSHHIAVVNTTMRNFSDNQQGGITTGYSDHLIFRGNRITNMGDPALGGQGLPTSQHAIYMAEGSHYLVIEGNYVEQISGYGLHAWGHSNYAFTTRNLIERKNTILLRFWYVCLIGPDTGGGKGRVIFLYSPRSLSLAR